MKFLQKLNNNKGITLISLVVTIVILVILAAVAINMAIGNNGLFTKSKQAKGEYVNASDKEKQDIDVLVNDIDIEAGSQPQATISASSVTFTPVEGWTLSANPTVAEALDYLYQH